MQATYRPPGSGLYIAPIRVAPLAEHGPAGRTLHLVDLENLMAGGPRGGAIAFADAVEAFEALSNRRPGDHLVVGTNPRLLPAAHQAFPGARLVCRGGPDGADLAILGAVAEPARVAPLFHRVVVGSGDGIFADVAARFVELGLRVEVVARVGALARRLRQAAHAVRLIHPSPASAITKGMIR